jgi:hypothetical protein
MDQPLPRAVHDAQVDLRHNVDPLLIINTQSDTADKSSIQGSSNECNLIVKSTAKFNFARLILIAVFDGGVSPGATAPTLSTQIITDFRFVVV